MDKPFIIFWTLALIFCNLTCFACDIHRGIDEKEFNNGNIEITVNKYCVSFKYNNPKDDPRPTRYTETGYVDLMGFESLKNILDKRQGYKFTPYAPNIETMEKIINEKGERIK
jgi:hypothetical protein